MLFSQLWAFIIADFELTSTRVRRDMATSSWRSTSDGLSPLMEVAKFLEAARGREGTIWYLPSPNWLAVADTRPTSVPKSLLSTVKNSQSSEREMDALVYAIEPRDYALCDRLDGMGLAFLCRLLWDSKPCLSQQRGLCLIAVGYAISVAYTRKLMSSRSRYTTATLTQLTWQP